MKSLRRFCLSALALGATLLPALAQQDAASITVTNGQKQMNLPLFPGTEQYRILGAPDLDSPWSILSSGVISGFTWTDPIAAPQGFFRVEAVSMSPIDTLAALVLNRLAYGPTPDELERVKAMGADAYIAEQLAPENIVESLDIDQVNTTREWRRVVVTGVPTNRDFYIYQTSPGDVYIDDLRIVPGTNPDAGGDVVVDGGFETSLAAWTVSTNMSNSFIDTAEAHSGVSSLHLITTTSGSTKESSIWKNLANVTLNSTYTLSFWWKPGANINPNLTLRFSGSGIVAQGNLSLATKLELDSAITDDLRAWHVLHAIRSKKQLEEVLLQFLENHFVTQVSKTRDYFDQYYDGGDIDERAYRTEYKEIQRWRAALEQPNCTFYDLLKVSVESPAQIIYLDTVNSRGDGSNIPNENYARELLELFTYGVDNGYDQTDITLMSRAWTGWSVNIVDPAEELNPLALRSTTLRPGGTNTATIENLEGVWAFNYKSARHWNQGATILFPGKTVPDRFGPPYAGRNYTLAVDIDPNINTNWQRVVATGTSSSTTLYMYLESPGDIYIDDVSIVAGANPDVGSNLVSNPGFETGITSWTVSPNHSTSVVEIGGAHSGNRSLHMKSTTPGSGRDTSIYKTGIAMTSGAQYTLSFWWRPGTNTASSLTLRLSGSGILASAPPRLPGSGLQEGYRVITHLADQPFTQEFMSVKLCRLFVHDNFVHGVYDYTDPNLSAEGKLVRACMDAWENNLPKGQIRKVLKVIFDSELFRSQGAAGHKVKTPIEFTVSAIRALRSENANGTATATTDGYNVKSPMDRMGAMKLFDRAEPDGYPEAAAPWISAGTLAERLRWVQSFLLPTTSSSGRGDAGTATFSDPVALLKKKLPSNQWNNASAVADYFLSILIPGEGKANLDLYRTAAINFLNTADNGGSSPFLGLPNSSTTDLRYDTRVRGMAAAIMTSQRFHEQ